jgi:hypothetical protein
MSQKFNAAIAVIGIDIGKNSFHLVGHDDRGAIATGTRPMAGPNISAVPLKAGLISLSD